jgi:hypothetical protein
MQNTTLNRAENEGRRSNGSFGINHVAPSRFEEPAAKITES